MNPLIDLLSQKTGLTAKTVTNILKLLEEGSTIPFIARYRKEMTGGATDEQLREFESIYGYSKKLLERKEEVSRLIAERSELNNDLRTRLSNAATLQEVEDIYRPFKEKKNTRAGAAIAAGLEPLADLLERAQLELGELSKRAESFVKGSVTTREDAIKGAQDILAERYSDDPRERDHWRRQILDYSSFEIKATKGMSEEGLFAKLAGKSEKIASIPSHRYLAIMRGVSEKELNVKITLDMDRVENTIKNYRIPRSAKSSQSLLLASYIDGFKRLLFPSLEREVHAMIKEKSDIQAINTFGKNLSQLLGSPPVTKRAILGADPAYRTGCKLAVVDENGMYLDHAVIYPTPPQSDYEKSAKVVKQLTARYGINAVAIGNGTASRETQEFFARLNRDEGLNLSYTVVSEAGASVYSASKIAQEEYPQLDVTIRGAISIAQRLRDPMAALVKIDPKSLGVGQYQHDVDQKLLEKKLGSVTEDLVNRIGVDPNSASVSLLSYVAGVGAKVARAIVEHREKSGAFKAKQELLKVKGLGAKAYEQCAGFFRIRDGNSVLDNTGVHPESYAAANTLLKRHDLPSITKDQIPRIAQELGVGEATLSDIIAELRKPGFDPRESLPPIMFRSDLTDIKELREGSIVSGVVRNIADFGAFVDIGLKNDGLIHISQMSEKRISHPLEVLSVNQQLTSIRVVEVDIAKGKVGLSLR
ncbi:Tex family protein [Sulfuricurvum sp. RIFCSPLOWO2_12_FULL_43_24]|uniref:helix-hairpin-helix domain-containing protein n=1 Tax=Sulfuricurvum sp. RIFCSPLOWO2_12_FULL_43_24 TaxID=1802247 RepID=UPI0008C088AD|nr:Tex family protein [Sulfuricurvum sp. RIFCSPLOWO2_12_FULL_43_24]OHD88327.1 MAG: RNA-binding protein [Sulfuricurvum sp. RIFCSPLOWO2_12_FULL_43_24]